MATVARPELPERPEELTAEFLSTVLDSKVESAELVEVIAGTATKVRMRLDYGDPDVGLPEQVCVKGGFDDAMRQLNSGNDAYRLEARFFGDLAPKLTIPLPRSFASVLVDEGSQGIVVMEDLVASGASFGDPCHAMTVNEVRSGLEVQAQWHASTWGQTSELAPWLRVGSEAVRAAGRMLLGPDYWSYFVEQPWAPDLPAALSAREELLGAFENLWRYEDANAACLCHGDAHIGNTYAVDGNVGFLDWQGIAVGPWSYDVAYFVTGALSIADRRRHERDLLRHYGDALALHGGPALMEHELWDGYRRHTLHGFLWAVTPPVMQTIERVHAMAERHIAAIEDHDTLALLSAATPV
jgi:hypothetical protein